MVATKRHLNRRMDDKDLELAAKVHYSFLKENYSDDHIDISVKGRPFGKVGGDYSSIVPVSEDKLFVCMCDTVGHGIASALLAARINTFILSHIHQHHDPCKLIHELNAHLFKRLAGTGMFTTFALIAFDFTASTMHFVGAAHPPLLHYKKATNEVVFMKSDATFLGILEKLTEGCPGRRHKIAPGDRILLYTDGISELKNPAGENFGNNRLKTFTEQSSSLDNDAFMCALMSEIANFSKGHYIDDMLAMGMHIK